jgi:hypothetical protein
VADNDGGSTWSASEAATVSEFSFNVGDDSTLGHGVDWQNVADGQSR